MKMYFAIWVNFSEWKDSGNTVDNTIAGFFSDVTQFYIGEHLNTFSKYIIIIIFRYAYK